MSLESRGTVAKITPFPASNSAISGESNCRVSSVEKVKVEDLKLIEKNRGKAGALNVYAELVRNKAIEWMCQHDLEETQVLVMNSQI